MIIIENNINTFVNTNNSELNTLTDTDNDLWQSNSPVGGVISIDIGPISFLGDDSTVICSQAESNFWIFLTVAAPSIVNMTSPFTTEWPDGFHPVSGNRQFGYFTNDAGNMELFTRGCDKFHLPPQHGDLQIGTAISYIVEKIAFWRADLLWESLQDGVSSFVNHPEQDGEASKKTPAKLRPPFVDAMTTLLKQSEPITSIPCE